MKKIFAILFFLMSGICLSQSYTFNLLTDYRTTTESKDSTKTYQHNFIYCNTEDWTYFLKLQPASKTKGAWLIDLKNSMVHNLRFERTGQKGSDIEFSYIETRKPWRMDSYRFYDIKNVGQDSLQKVVRFIAYNDKHKNKERFTSRITIKKMDQNLTPIFNFSILPLYIDNELQMISEGGGIVIKSVNSGSSNSVDELVYSEIVDLEIKIPYSLPVSAK